MLELKHYDEALVQFQRALSLDPDEAEYYKSKYELLEKMEIREDEWRA